MQHLKSEAHRSPPQQSGHTYPAVTCWPTEEKQLPFRQQPRRSLSCASWRGPGSPTQRTACSSSLIAMSTTPGALTHQTKLLRPIFPFLYLTPEMPVHPHIVSRPTRPVQWWHSGEGKEILGGRDELGGGTWLACTRDGRLALVTNVREPDPRVGAKSRGELPVRFLQGNQSPLEYAKKIAKEADQYNGFNLILADVRSGTMVYISNRPTGDPVCQTVPPGFHVLSNAALDSPWPKALRLGHSFNNFLERHDYAEVSLKQMVQELMTDNVKADRSMLPITGVNPEQEYERSSIFINTGTGQGQYGTRSMAAVAVKLDGEVTFYERYLESSLWKENLTQFYMEMAQ